MSSFVKQMKRQSEAAQRANTKKHINKFYKILHELDIVAKEMISSGIIITEDNVVEEASKYTNKKIDNYEKMILLSKTQQVYNKIIENEKQTATGESAEVSANVQSTNSEN